MKQHAIIPIFIPHQGCPNDCVFCNQRKITAKDEEITPQMAIDTIEEWLTTLENNVPNIEIAFYGGSFTGLPQELQNQYLSIAKKYKDSGRVHKIHLSTRPDYIDEDILDNLKKYSVDVIELGVQSFDKKVLEASKRGHKVEDVYKASDLIKEYGFTLGIQLMVGLPGDNIDTCIYSAKETVKIGPSIARIYPTIVIEETELYDMYQNGKYNALSIEQAIEGSKAIYKILDEANINIIRVGLKASELINDKAGSNIAGKTFHPAFRQLVESSIARDIINAKLSKIEPSKESFESNRNPTLQRKIKVDVISNSKDFSNMIGNNKSNKEYFAQKYPKLNIKYTVDNNLQNGNYLIKIK